MTLISVVSSADTSTVYAELMKLNGVEVVYEITGKYDIIAIISGPTITDVNKCIDGLSRTEGVSDTNTVIILKTIR